MERTGLSPEHIYERIDQGGFPRQMALGPRSDRVA
ncbi:helix-turn-helix transcriptional regulator [Mycobacterium tuberculosis]